MDLNKLLSHNELLEKEPDLVALRAAHKQLKSDPLASLTQLERLAKTGSVLAMSYLAEFYRRRLPPDLDQSKFWYLKAFEHNSLNAAYNLGTLCYHRGEIEEARLAFSRGAEQNDGPCLYWSAKLALDRAEIDAVPTEVEKLLKSATKLGQVRARNHLGTLYLKGRYGPQKVPFGIYLYVRSLWDTFAIGISNPDDRRLW